MRLGLKIAMVVVLVLAILIPLAMIRGTIAERQQYRQQAVDEVTRSYAGEQGLAGPVLVVPYREQVEVEERDATGVLRKQVREVDRQWLFFPKTMHVHGRVLPSIRKRGLHQVRVYEWQGSIDAAFDVRLPDADPARPRTLGAPWLDIGIADVRGLVGAPTLRVAGAATPILQGQKGRGGGGVHAVLPAALVAGERIAFPVQFGFALRGTEALAIVPLADTNRIVLDSPWPHPQFNGDFLPRTHRIDGKGFHAEWDVSSLASNAQAQYREGGAAMGKATPAPGHDGVAAAVEASASIDRVGLSLVEPVNLYSKVDRASKYGLLFVLLTFVGFFLFETIKQLPIHPIQYALVGLALAIFFLLLLSLSEHIAFGLAYSAAALACIGLIGYYVGHVLRSRTRGMGFAAMLGLLYAALYGLLMSEDNALVLGAGLLFVVLAAIMVATRKVDWYQVGARIGAPSAPTSL
ncbi:cell envelope integrity protein CreD [Thermomonas sp.]|uniref:cell envelope integrity protein CreD n=1 Tax=Thermomonas sp. TaxID=1971895 RepID=UPI002614FCD9|nr:cell envelope integrity protein CreD [Thermomonas sp.]MBK7206551.1 cell envelope integrity protein CreD [Thermomonas sp.]MBK9670190.1 cell envelope integrity protein CreD [Thermomonas sp.]MBL0229228.1 cell envelope integrity protein CreD [Thermomonas sp.]HRA02763.1 cell envelope integrity protein CreD [Thermomonas sp.]